MDEIRWGCRLCGMTRGERTGEWYLWRWRGCYNVRRGNAAYGIQQGVDGIEWKAGGEIFPVVFGTRSAHRSSRWRASPTSLCQPCRPLKSKSNNVKHMECNNKPVMCNVIFLVRSGFSHQTKVIRIFGVLHALVRRSHAGTVDCTWLAWP